MEGLIIAALAIIFGVVIWSIADGVIRKPEAKMTLSKEQFTQVKDAIQAGKSDEEIMDTLYVEKHDINVVRLFLSKKAKEKLNGN